MDIHTWYTRTQYNTHTAPQNAHTYPLPSPAHISTHTDELRPALLAAFKRLVISPQGVLFENAMLQIGLKHEYRGSQGSTSSC